MTAVTRHALRAGPTVAVLPALRAATSAAHRAIEQAPLLAALQSPGLTGAAYLAVLRRWHRHFSQAEPPLVAALSGLCDAGWLAGRARLPLVARDLADLGDPGPHPPAPPGPSLTPAAALGRFYVHEGAAMGGRVILQAVTAALGHDGRRGARFLHGSGSATAAEWREVQALLARHLDRADWLDEAVAEACATFAAIGAAMRAEA